MNVNAVSMSSNGLELQGSEILTNPSVSRIRPRADNKVDIGSASKRIKTLFYTTLDPLPGGGVGPFLPLNGSSAMAGTLAMGTNNISNIGTISGATNSRIADNILSNAGTGVAGNCLHSFRQK